MGKLVLGCVIALSACSSSERQSPSSAGADAGTNESTADAAPWSPSADAAPPAAITTVFAHSDSELYRIDPDTLDVALVGAFAWPGTSDQMTDIAIDKNGVMIGISFDRVYSVDPDTAQTVFLADLDRSFNGLSFVPAPGSGNEMLLAAALDGSIYELNPMTGQATPRGNYGGGMGSSGDLVSVEGFGTAATVTVSGGGSDRLAVIDAEGSSAAVVGDTGQSSIWGLGFWAGQVFGFASDGSFVLIDVNTGMATLVEQSGVSWWGAGVTTHADVTVD